jgi:Protein of unknown function (DUF4236)
VGLFFRKSLRLAPGVRLTLSKRSASVSAGPRGAKVGASTSGRRRLSFSRGGVFWRKRV